MTNGQKILIAGALALTAGLYFFGPTVAPKKAATPAAQAAATPQLDFDKLRNGATQALSPQRQQFVAGLEASIKRGDVNQQTITVYRQLGAFWRDSVPNPVLHFHYNSLAAELENTEKSLTFAAHSILEYLPYAHNPQEQVYMANMGSELFEKALKLNAKNDSSIVGLGGTIMYGASAADGPMAGIMKVREVADRDSTNLFAQYMLGVGGVLSGQYDKAALRFEKVVKAQPDNIELLFKLAETYELQGNKAEAVKWYEQLEKKVEVPQMKAEIRKRIEQLKAG